MGLQISISFSSLFLLLLLIDVVVLSVWLQLHAFHWYSITLLQGLKDLADSLPQGSSNRYLTDGVAEDGSLKSNDPPRSLLMRYSACSNFLFYSFFLGAFAGGKDLVIVLLFWWWQSFMFWNFVFFLSPHFVLEVHYTPSIYITCVSSTRGITMNFLLSFVDVTGRLLPSVDSPNIEGKIVCFSGTALGVGGWIFWGWAAVSSIAVPLNVFIPALVFHLSSTYMFCWWYQSQQLYMME